MGQFIGGQQVKEYLIQLKGTYFIKNEYKQTFKYLDLNREFYRINQDVNIEIDYMSFLINAESEFEITSSPRFFEKIRLGLVGTCTIVNNVYKTYVDYITNCFNIQDLKLEELYIKPTGRTNDSNGFYYCGEYFNTAFLEKGEKNFVSNLVTRIISTNEIEELDNYFNYATDKINKKEYKNKDIITNIIENCYNVQSKKVLNEKRVSIFNRKSKVKWQMKTSREITFDDIYNDNWGYENILWESKNEYSYKNSDYNIKYKYFINVDKYLSSSSYGFHTFYDYIFTVDVVISPQYFDKGKLEIAANENMINISDVEYYHLNKDGKNRFCLGSKRLSGFEFDSLISTEGYDDLEYENIIDYIEYEFDAAKIFEEVLSRDGTLRTEIPEESFNEFYVDKIEKSLLNKFNKLHSRQVVANKKLSELIKMLNIIHKNIKPKNIAMESNNQNSIEENGEIVINTLDNLGLNKFTMYKSMGNCELSAVIKIYMDEITNKIEEFVSENDICCSCLSKAPTKLTNSNKRVCNECYEAHEEEFNSILDW